MKDILFKPDMIKAIVEGRKTQTRRLDNLREINKESDKWRVTLWKIELPNVTGAFIFSDGIEKLNTKPRYKVGEVVYIKEAWATSKKYDNLPPRDIPADAPIWYGYTSNDVPKTSDVRGKWRSPMFLKEVNARYFIKITGVRAERLQEITEADAEAEGIMPELKPDDAPPAMRYSFLWDSINPKYPWANNDWVWVYEFERVKCS